MNKQTQDRMNRTDCQRYHNVKVKKQTAASIVTQNVDQLEMFGWREHSSGGSFGSGKDERVRVEFEDLSAAYRFSFSTSAKPRDAIVDVQQLTASFLSPFIPLSSYHQHIHPTPVHPAFIFPHLSELRLLPDTAEIIFIVFDWYLLM